VRSPHGLATIVDPDRPLWERDTISCGHCGKVVFVKPNTLSTVYLIPHRDGRWTEEDGAGCHLCSQPVCLPCYDLGVCTPLERQLAHWERH
jgi:NAD-dependent dihydropyrimidine dehydrogenase PreA subunit